MSQFVLINLMHDVGLTKNVRICFWNIDNDLYNAEELVQNSDEIIQRAKDRDMPCVDIVLLKEAVKHLYAFCPPLFHII